MNQLVKSNVPLPPGVPRTSPQKSNNWSKFIADEAAVREYIQQQFHEFPTKELVLATDYYRDICQVMYCKELTLYYGFVMEKEHFTSIHIRTFKLTL